MSCWHEKATVDFDEQVAKVMLRFGDPMPGVAFARAKATNRPDKYLARQRIRRSLQGWGDPGRLNLKLFTMPGLHWTFESELIGRKRVNGMWRKRLEITAVERERPVYLASIRYMPQLGAGVKSIGNALSTRFIDAYYCMTFEHFTCVNEKRFDAAWLDFTGPMRIPTMDAIRRFWPSVNWMLAVTVLNARYDSLVKRELKRHDGLVNWLKAELPNAVICDDYSYCDTVPMQQVIIQKSHIVKAEEWVSA